MHYQSLSIRPGIDNVKSTKPALGSTERCCRFNQAGLLRNDRPLLLRFPKPVPVRAFLPVLWSLLPMQMPCYLFRTCLVLAGLLDCRFAVSDLASPAMTID